MNADGSITTVTVSPQGTTTVTTRKQATVEISGVRPSNNEPKPITTPEDEEEPRF